MSKQRYIDKKFAPESWRIIEIADNILREYTEQRLVVTVRQLYYQFVARDLLPNTQKNYKRLADIVSEARMAGHLDWDAIEDRGRVPATPSEWESIEDIVNVAMRQFRLPRLLRQKVYPELWVEKQALAGVLEPVARQHHVTLMVNKGYSSASAMRESALRFRRNMETMEETSGTRPDALLLYLGDHDPSGEDMVRDIEKRLTLFGVEDLEVKKVALTMEQIKQHKPPPNPAKSTDPRFKGYQELHGDESWELDALEPSLLQRLVQNDLRAALSPSIAKAVVDEENRQRSEMSAAIDAARARIGARKQGGEAADDKGDSDDE